MSTAQTMLQEAVTLNVAELEAIIRRVVREELTRAFEMWGFDKEPTIIEPGSPIHEDLDELLRMKKAGTLGILSRQEALEADDDISS